ncbi:MAG: exodeoxyribonuclease III [Ilumatobacteraceae bacterium]
MRIATWNVNSLKARLPRVEEWLAEVQPDVVCLQETKLSDDAWPALTFAGLGYESTHHGQGQWNGVAILSKVGLADVVANFAPGTGDPDPDARIITARCGGVSITSVYVPNGRSLDNDHYQYKLRWLAQLRRHLDAVGSPDEPLIVTGDFNIAPDDRDVFDPSKFVDATHVSEPERVLLRDLESWGLVDLFRQLWPQDRLYSWWDYRAGDFHQGRGLRIDLVLGTKVVAERLSWSIVDRNARKGTSPSDHAPVIVDLADLVG